MTRLLRVLLMACALCLCSCSGLSRNPQNEVHHVVLVWLKPEYKSADYLVKLTQEMQVLRGIPGLNSLSYGGAIASDRPIVDDSFDLAVLMTFKDEVTMRSYVDHPLHQEFVGNFIAGKVTKLLIYDF